MSASNALSFGYLTAAFGDRLEPSLIVEVAETAERLGYDVVSVSDHLTFPEDLPKDPIYPTDDAPYDIGDRVYELFDVLSFLAAATDDLTLMSNICVVPYRHPVLLAKSALTTESLSGGRLAFGVGSGWCEPEFEVLDTSFEDRGGLTDEFLDLFDHVCDNPETGYDGPYHSFQRTGFHPVPDRDIPVWIGGFSEATFRRVAEYGDGWTSVWMAPGEIDRARSRIMAAWDDYDRDGEPKISVLHPIHVGADHRHAGNRLVGDPDHIIEGVQAYVDAGVTCLQFLFYSQDPKYQRDQLQRFRDAVIPTFR